jgi:hypothetical protein
MSETKPKDGGAESQLEATSFIDLSSNDQHQATCRVDEVVVNGYVCDEQEVIVPVGDPTTDSTVNIATSTKPKSESLSDWLVLVGVCLFNATNGINLAGYSVLYIAMTDVFDTTYATVGWIGSAEGALACLLGELRVYGPRE